MDDPRGRGARRGKTVVATTHDLACAAQRFQQVAHGQPDGSSPTGRRRLILDPRRPGGTYGGHLARARRADGRPRRRPPPRRRARQASGTSTRAVAPAAAGRTTSIRSPDGPPDRAADPRASCRALDRGVARRDRLRGRRARSSSCKGLAFIGDAISHAAFPGVVAAYILNGPILVGAGIAAVGTALAIGFVTRRGGAPRATPRSACCSPGRSPSACSCSARSRATSATCSGFLFGYAAA